MKNVAKSAEAQRIILRREPDLTMKQSSFPYQADAVRSIRDLEYSAIFHEQGLGKTKIAIDLAAYWLGQKILDTVLLVAKKSLIDNWHREFQYHSSLSPKTLTNNRSANFYVFNSPTRVILTHYEAVKSEFPRFQLFLRTRRVGVILDESTKIKNPSSSLTKVFLNLRDQFAKRVIMTGTPAANRPHDVWSQIAFLDGGESLGHDFAEFKRTLAISNDLAKVTSKQTALRDAMTEVHGKISHFTVRETKSSGVVNLPRKVFKTLVSGWEPSQLDMYRQIRETLRMVVVQDGKLRLDDSESVLKRLLRLVQVTSNPSLVDQQYRGEPGKLPVLLDLVTRITDQEEKCIIWSSFVDNVEWLANELSAWSPRKIHGGMHMDSRNISVRRFMQDDEVQILIATPSSAKEGLTLTIANHAIFYDRNFSLDDYLQAQDRIHRISQDRTCFIYNIVMQDSIDLWIEELLDAKRTAAQLIQGDITESQYDALMSYEFGETLKAVLDSDRI